MQDIAVLKMSRLCQELDEDEDLVAVSGEIAGDFTPCKARTLAGTAVRGPACTARMAGCPRTDEATAIHSGG